AGFLTGADHEQIHFEFLSRADDRVRRRARVEEELFQVYLLGDQMFGQPVLVLEWRHRPGEELLTDVEGCDAGAEGFRQTDGYLARTLAGLAVVGGQQD